MSSYRGTFGDTNPDGSGTRWNDSPSDRRGNDEKERGGSTLRPSEGGPVIPPPSSKDWPDKAGQ